MTFSLAMKKTFRRNLNQDERRKRLQVLYYSYKDKSEKLLFLDECPKKFASLDGWDTEFHYFYSGNGQ